MSKLNIALIGAGRRGGGSHLPVIAKLKDVYNLVAICDMAEETATRFAEQYGANPYTNVRDLVKHEALDVVDITVPGSSTSCHCMLYGRCRCAYPSVKPRLRLRSQHQI